MTDPFAALLDDPLIETGLFPDPRDAADEYGLVAIGGDFRPSVLLAAYRSGIFPWPSEELPYAWFCPDPRLILRPRSMRINRSLRKSLRRGAYRVTFDRAFERVIEACATAPRPEEAGTWIMPELRQGFEDLHRYGYAHSVEVWSRDSLVGGLYGLSLGGMFCGESMFHTEPNASKAALVALTERLAEWDFRFIDCQVHTEHLASLGAHEMSREAFLEELDRALEVPTRRGSWDGEET